MAEGHLQYRVDLLRFPIDRYWWLCSLSKGWLLLSLAAIKYLAWEAVKLGKRSYLLTQPHDSWSQDWLENHLGSVFPDDKLSSVFLEAVLFRKHAEANSCLTAIM